MAQIIAEDQVAIFHEVMADKDNPPVVSRKSYDLVWKDKGWRLSPQAKKENK